MGWDRWKMLNLITSKKSFIENRLSDENKNKKAWTIGLRGINKEKNRGWKSLKLKKIRRTETKMCLYWTIDSWY